MSPPPTGKPVESRHSTVPASASSARTSPFRSPVKTRPPAVGVTPATSGVGDLYFQRTFPLSASTAVIQPPHCACGSLRPNGCSGSPEPDHAPPGLPTALAAVATFTDVHQSVALTNSKFNDALKPGPFHSVPPFTPGQKRVSEVVLSGTFTLKCVVTGVAYTIFI